MATSKIASSPDNDAFLAMIHRMVLLRARMLLKLTSELKPRKGGLTALMSGDFSGTNFAYFVQLGLALHIQDNGLNMSEISRALNVPLSTATRVVDYMVQSRLLRRKADPKDRRMVRILLTAAGRRSYAQANEFMIKHVEHVLNIFTPDERRAFLPLMHKLANELERGISHSHKVEAQ